jgi:signal transduction histidine kinase
MDRSEAFEMLRSTAYYARLVAARALATVADAGDVTTLQSALAVETNTFVKRALEMALRRVGRDAEQAEAAPTDDVPSLLLQQLKARAVEEVTRTLLHEIEATVGQIDLAASGEIKDYDASRTKLRIRRLSDQLVGIAQLKAAAASPKNQTFPLGPWVRELVMASGFNRDLFLLVGPDNLSVTADPALLGIAISNGLKNAVEAVEAFHAVRIGPSEADPPSRIVVSWDVTDVEAWVSIKDDGIGLTSAATSAALLGRTTKPNHSGLGLPTARQAMESMGGSLSLEPGAHNGARFEVRWFVQ